MHNTILYYFAAVQGPISFMASLSKDMTSVGPNEVIPFDNITTNIGGYYIKSGLFQATVPGAYVFTVSVTSLPGHYISVQLTKMGQELCRASSTGSTSGTCTAHAHLTDTDIWVQHFGMSGDYLAGGNHSTFSGHLIQADK
jgi:hypothetical protein